MAIGPADNDGAANTIEPDDPTQVSVSTAMPMPPTTPRIEPATPRTKACDSTKLMT